jgi:hypothetical protein
MYILDIYIYSVRTFFFSIWILDKYQIWDKENVSYYIFKSSRVDGKEIDIHPWGLKIKPHNWYSYGQWLYVDHIFLT